MNRCLRCGASNRKTKYPRYDCDCGGYLVPVSANMLPTARLLHELGFQIASATDSIHALHIDGYVEITMITVDFMRVYDAQIFADLPEGFTVTDYRLVDYETGIFSTYTKIVHTDNFFPALYRDRETRRALRATIRRLHVWAEEMKTSGRWAIYTLGGLI